MLVIKALFVKNGRHDLHFCRSSGQSGCFSPVLGILNETLHFYLKRLANYCYYTMTALALIWKKKSRETESQTDIVFLA